MIVKNKTRFVQFIDGNQVFPYREIELADDVQFDESVWERTDVPPKPQPKVQPKKQTHEDDE